MIALYGVPVAEADAHTLVDMLLRVGRADDLAAADAIDRGLSLEARMLALTPEMRDAILGVLDDPPDGLVELRGKLALDNAYRRTV